MITILVSVGFTSTMRHGPLGPSRTIQKSASAGGAAVPRMAAARMAFVIVPLWKMVFGPSKPPRPIKSGTGHDVPECGIIFLHPERAFRVPVEQRSSSSTLGARDAHRRTRRMVLHERSESRRHAPAGTPH